MFNIGPLELVVLALVGIIVVGPDKLPGLAKEAARMIRTLRELASGARTQLREELGPEFADVDLRNLNPRTAIQRMVLGDPEELRALNPRNALNSLFTDEDRATIDPRASINEMRPDQPVSMTKPAAAPQHPLGRGEPAPFDDDAT
jgi:sec-independent protein translocase protein TatB